MNRYLPYLSGIGVALTWGFSFMFTREALDYLSPFHLLGLRFAAAIAAMFLLRLLNIIRIRIKASDYISLLPLALFQPILYFSAETAGILLTSASYAGMMIAIIPIFVAILSAIILREYPNRIQIIFIIASVAGVIFIIYMGNQSIAAVNHLGTLALMGAVLAAGFFNITSRRASARHTPMQITWVMMMVGAVCFNLIALAQHLLEGNAENYLTPLTETWITVIYLGVISSVGAFFLYNYVLSRITATQGAVFANLVTVVAVSAGVIFRGETIFWYHLAGTTAILIGVWGTNHFAPQPHENFRFIPGRQADI
jgi:drug/metabolite transporter (DMT)-like permease